MHFSRWCRPRSSSGRNCGRGQSGQRAPGPAEADRRGRGGRAGGYRIVARNVRLRGGELNVVAEDAGTIVFVEVKARRSRTFGTPAEAVGPRKRRTLYHLALATWPALADRPCRFDVVEVWVDSAGALRAGVLRDGFRP